jgi:hypothetical protein
MQKADTQLKIAAIALAQMLRENELMLQSHNVREFVNAAREYELAADEAEKNGRG